MQILRIALDIPLYGFFDYRAPADVSVASRDDIGRRVRVPFGTKSRIGVLVELPESSEVSEHQLKDVEAILHDLAPLPADWFRVCEFCANYYQAPLGEVMLSTLPAGLRRLDPPKARVLKRPAKALAPHPAPPLTDEQQVALDAIATGSAAPICCTASPAAVRPRFTYGWSSARWRLDSRRCSWCRKST